MEEETSWITNCFDDIGDECNNVNPMISIDFLLPDDLLERILAYLPIANIFRASCACKRWNEIVNSKKLNVLSQKPWYFMFTSSDEPIGYAYDPILRKWYSLELPCIEAPNWFIASSCGLVCFMDNDNRSQLFVRNPITKDYKRNYWDYFILILSIKLSLILLLYCFL
ncbi:hypothetical protein NE237_029249 [Protea cynaroides]|uniref:F-box domain-containing protein n=1 Tax=Protea cynaroides TaxID=273540 RepID=A0A9Q0GQV6_9MAGN|nr:hypothetical protein NE237_029249 [Protea cynaroides]